MRELHLKKNDEGRRLDKVIFKYLDKAPSSFVYKMMRKKNITLNKKKCDGHETVHEGDIIYFFLSDETIDKFKGSVENLERSNKLPGKWDDFKLDVVYEDENILCVNKPAGILSQKAEDSDVSINELCLAYLKNKGEYHVADDELYTPSVCNRLDRNTEGIILFAKTYICARTLSEALRDRTIHKYYYCIVKGIVPESLKLDGYLLKDEKNNTVKIVSEPIEGAGRILTAIEPIKRGRNVTLLRVELLTGKSHQIRAHLSSIGHPLIGDPKYGDADLNRKALSKFGIKYQMLFSYKVIFPDMDGELSYLSGKVLEEKLPKVYEDVLNGDLEK